MRLHDNLALCQSIANAQKQQKTEGGSAILLPVFCFDPRIFGTHARSVGGSAASLKKCSPRRAKFVLEGVIDLRNNLQRLGSGLVVAKAMTPEQACSEILTTLSKNSRSNHESNVAIPSLVCQQEVCSEELAVDKAIRSVLKKHNPKATFQTVWDSTMYSFCDLPFAEDLHDFPNGFTPFRNKVEKSCKIGRALPVPSRAQLVSLLSEDDSSSIVAAFEGNDNISLNQVLTLQDLGYTEAEIQGAESIDPRGVMEFHGGETVGLERVKSYIWDKDCLKDYFETRNGMIGADYSSKFAPWLAHGFVSPRYIASQCRKYEEERVANKSTYWLVFELLWRDYFKFFALKHGTSIFLLGGTAGHDKKKWKTDEKSIQLWKEGRTGYPLVDANMRELAATGFMSNRGRQNVCSFFAIDLHQDWRIGAAFFESTLIDYDVHSNWGNWCAGAGLTGSRLNRFNIVKQSKDYDQHGEYVRRWLPELANVPTALVHEPWKMTQFQQMEYGCRLGIDYPNPMIPPSAPYKKPGRGGGPNNGDHTQHGGGSTRQKHNPKKGKHQRMEMKSLKTGTFEIKA